MKQTLFIIIFVIVLFFQNAFGQYVKVGQKGQDFRDMIAARIIIDSFPKDSLDKLLEHKGFLTVTISTDTSGCLRNILRVRSRKVNVTPTMIIQVQNAWIQSGQRIPIVYSVDGVNSQRAEELAIKEIQESANNGKDSIVQTLGFPPECSWPFINFLNDSCSSSKLLKDYIYIFFENYKTTLF